MGLLQRASRAFFIRHPAQLALAILGIAIGVAAAVAVDLAVSSAHSAFEASMRALLGSTTHQIVRSGGPIDEAEFVALSRRFPDIRMSPVVDGALEHEGMRYRLNGIDLVAAATGGAIRGGSGLTMSLAELLLGPSTALIARADWDRLGLSGAPTLAFQRGTTPQRIRILGPIEGDGPAEAALEGVLLADIATAQEILGKLGLIDRIDLVLGDEPGLERRIGEALPAGLHVVSAAARTEATGRLSRAFETNLRAMSLLGLIVGLFLIYNTMMFAVLQRRELIATLRLLGATRREILLELLAESLLLGAVGGAIGLLLGVFASEFLIGRVTRTLNDVYYVLTVRHLTIDPNVLLRCFLLGLAASMLAGLLPAVEAAGVRPLASRMRSRIEESGRRGVNWAAACGAIAVVVALWLLRTRGASLEWSIAGLFLMLLGCGLAIPIAVGFFGLPARHIGSPSLRLALGGIADSLSRTGIAVAALAMAFAAAFGVGTMTLSFRTTVEDWLNQLMQSDFYVAKPAADQDADEVLRSGLPERLAAVPGVEVLSTARRARVESDLGPVELVALQLSDQANPGYRLKEGDPRDVWRRFNAGEAVLVSEPLASRFRLQAGASIELLTVLGRRRFSIAGVVYDYRSDRGIVLMQREAYRAGWRDEGITSIGLTLRPGYALHDVKNALRGIAGEGEAVEIRSNREIREASLVVFDRTFAVTEVLRILAVAVAVVGLIGSQLAMQLERAWEFAMLRTLGMTPAQLTRFVVLQSGALGLAAGVFAVPVGALMAWVLVAIIQYVSFGWSMRLVVPFDACWQTPLLAGVSAVVAGLYPAWRVARANPAVALRDE